MVKEILLKICTGRFFPLATVTQKLAWLGTTGSGKTYGASKLAEQFWYVGAQFVVLDPVGVWYGLRLASDGRRPSKITIPIFGGLHGDVPLEPTAGALIADLIVDKGISCILDVSQFETDASKAKFAGEFADRFFFRKKAAPSAVHLFLEECQEFVPQNPQRGEERMLHAFIRMQKLGRNFGIGSSYITQRPQEVNKKALNMAQTLFVFRNTGTHERAAIEKWIEDKSLDETIAQDLPKLATGQCHIWSPEFLKISEVVQILEKQTFNASATPEVGAVARARKLAPIDLDKVRSDMAATIEKAKGDDPKLLKKRIGELERELVGIDKKIPTKVIDQSAIDRAVADALKKADGMFSREREQWRKLVNTISGAMRNAAKLLALEVNMPESLIAGALVSKIPDKDLRTPKTITVAVRPPVQVRPLGEDSFITPSELLASTALIPSEMGASERKILVALAQHQDGMTREHITVLTGFKKSTRNTYISRLTSRGMVEMAGDRVIPTPAGIDALGGDYEPLLTGQELAENLLNTLPPGEAAILKVLLDRQEAVSRDELTEITGQQKSTRNTYISRLATRQLVVYEGGSVRASDKLF